jgi:hypothetical protein
VENAPEPAESLRTLAAAQVEKKQDFTIHLAAYLAVNAFLVVIWAVSGGGFWPIFPIVGWGIGLALHAWSVYGRNPMTSEARIGAEEERLRAKGVDSKAD